MMILALLVVFAGGPAHAEGDAAAGKAVYAANCTACHGATGNGKGPAAIALKPKPTDFTDPAWQSGRTDEVLLAAIKGGRPNTSMTPFTSLSDTDLRNLVTYVRTLGVTPG